jgi:hypothetical protein
MTKLTRLMVLGITVCSVMLIGATAHATPTLDFNIGAHSPSVGSINYSTLGGPLVGTGIKPDNVAGLGTPLNDGASRNCIGCSLSFTTGNLTSTNATSWFFGGGGSVTLTGGVDLDNDGDTTAAQLDANDIAAGSTLLSGIFQSAEVDKSGTTFKVTIALFTDTKNPKLLSFYGLPSGSYIGNFNISFNATGSPSSTFHSSNVRSGDISNTPTVPEPGTLMLLGSGLSGLGYLVIRRRKAS